MPESTQTILLDDLSTDIEALDFQPYVDTFADIVRNGITLLTIGVFGTWGSGKTSLMRMVKKGLPEEFNIAWFDAWKYDKEETLWRPAPSGSSQGEALIYPWGGDFDPKKCNVAESGIGGNSVL